MNAATSTTVFPITPAKAMPYAVMVGIGAVLFLSAGGMAWWAYRGPTPLYAAMFIEFAVGALLVYLARASRSTSVELGATALRIRGNLFGKTIARADLIPDQARVVDLQVETNLAPKWRLYGVGLPQYQAGWFTLCGGGKALLFLTDRTQAVHVPTRNGYAIILNVENPQGFLRALNPQK